MEINDTDRVVSRPMYQVAVGIVASREHPSIAEIAKEALDRPTSSTIRALLAAGRGQAWLPSIIDALVQVGIAAEENVLGDQA